MSYQSRVQELNSREYDLVDRLDAMHICREADARIAALEAECAELRKDAEQRFIAVGWIRQDGSMHRGCPPINEPAGWTALLAAMDGAAK